MQTILFPGQGSQRKGMGAGLFERFAPLTQRAEEILGYSIRELCLEDPRRELDLTQFTQPALFVVNALAYFQKGTAGSGAADFFAGHSLGELNALMAAGCFDFETGVAIVKKRGELLARVKNGGMAAILNASRELVETTLREHGLTGVDVAVHNSQSQCVVAGSKEELARAERLFSTPPVAYHPLNTSGAFHSRYMKEVAAEYGVFLRNVSWQPLQTPVIANATARRYEPGQIAATLVAQISQPVRWYDTIEYLRSCGDMQFEEVGFGDVLTRIVRTITAGTPQKPAATSGGAKERVSRWNQRHAVGTRVRSSILHGQELETRTEAMVLFGHRAAVYVKDHNGYFDLDQIEPLQP